MKNHDLGKRGEEIATKFLQEKKYEILHQNWRYQKAELDIICKDQGILVIVEVKARSSNRYGEPETFVSRTQQRHLIRAVNAFVEHFDWQGEIRFDILSICFYPFLKIKHLKNAFYP